MNDAKILAPRRGEKEVMETSPKTDIVLGAGEFFIEKDSTNGLYRVKIGDGVTTYENLPYAMSGNSYDINFDPSTTGMVSTNVDSAIKEVKEGVDMFTANGLYYGTCSTAAATAAKEVVVSNQGFGLAVGAVITVKFTNTNTASSCTINVNGTGAHSLYYDTSVYTGDSPMICGAANKNITYVYDGTNWVWIGGTYESLPASSSGTDVTLVTTGEKQTWNDKVDGEEMTAEEYEQITPDPDTCYFLTPDTSQQ